MKQWASDAAGGGHERFLLKRSYGAMHFSLVAGHIAFDLDPNSACEPQTHDWKRKLCV